MNEMFSTICRLFIAQPRYLRWRTYKRSAKSKHFIINVNLPYSTMTERKPKFVAFDLDYTLWPFWVDTHVVAPFRKDPAGVVVDSRGSKIKFYPDVPEVLKQLHEQGYILAVASRTSEIPGANQLLDLFDWDKYFTYKEIFPGCKVTHFNNIQRKSGIDFADMIFFDDEDRNIKDLTQHGVTSILVRGGVTKRCVEDGLKEYARQHQNGK